MAQAPSVSPHATTPVRAVARILRGRLLDRRPMSTETRPSSPWFALVLLAVGSLGVAAAWVLLVLARNEQSSWMAVVAAADAALLLRLGRMRPGAWRALAGVTGTALAIAAANWGIVAGQLGKVVGLLPWESITRLGPSHAWTLMTAANPQQQLAWLVSALVIAAVASR